MGNVPMGFSAIGIHCYSTFPELIDLRGEIIKSLQFLTHVVLRGDLQMGVLLVREQHGKV
ncbi:MAG: hypothetical protein OEY91_12580 [Nitrospirota bacterium]|jgi:hypothetical protein|nr:hypothetical protein [Nitrospirota bacterium]